MRKPREYDEYEAEADEAEAYEPPEAYEDEVRLDEGEAFFGPDPLLDRWDDDPQ